MSFFNTFVNWFGTFEVLYSNAYSTCYMQPQPIYDDVRLDLNRITITLAL